MIRGDGASSGAHESYPDPPLRAYRALQFAAGLPLQTVPRRSRGQADHALLRECRSDWQRIRPAVRVGHVGLGGEYADDVDLLCPFHSINGVQTAAPLPQHLVD